MADIRKILVRLVNRGDVVRVKSEFTGEWTEDVVRDVQIVLNMAGGYNVVIPANDDIDKVLDPLPTELEVEVEAMLNPIEEET